MKTLFTIAILTLVFFNGITQNKTIGINLVNRHLNDYNYSYPRFSFEYSVGNFSSFESFLEYINHSPSGRKVISYPLSIGYKFNALPLFIKNEQLSSRLKIYNSLRYTILFSPTDSNQPLSNLRTFHYLRYAPGVDFYFKNNLGLNTEMVFGQSMKTTFALGIKYRF